VRRVISKGLERTLGDYRRLVDLFGMSPGDYRRFLNLLRKYDCHESFDQFRPAKAEMSQSRRPERWLA
jgi:hypothetical protein